MPLTTCNHKEINEKLTMGDEAWTCSICGQVRKLMVGKDIVTKIGRVGGVMVKPNPDYRLVLTAQERIDLDDAVAALAKPVGPAKVVPAHHHSRVAGKQEEIISKAAAGNGIRKIARETGVAVNTVRKLVREPAATPTHDLQIQARDSDDMEKAKEDMEPVAKPVAKLPVKLPESRPASPLKGDPAKPFQYYCKACDFGTDDPKLMRSHATGPVHCDKVPARSLIVSPAEFQNMRKGQKHVYMDQHRDAITADLIAHGIGYVANHWGFSYSTVSGDKGLLVRWSIDRTKLPRNYGGATVGRRKKAERGQTGQDVTRKDVTRSGPSKPDVPSVEQFCVYRTELDQLSDDDFAEVWRGIGVIVRVRIRNGQKVDLKL